MSENKGLTVRETELNQKGVQLKTMQDLTNFAEMIVKSGLAPKAFDKKESVIIAIQFGLEIGLSPMSALQSVAVINGMPSIYGDAAKALVLSDPICEYVKEWHEGSLKDGTLTYICESKRKGEYEIPHRTEYNIDDAKRAGLWNSSLTWKKHPKRMLMFRARGFELRDNFADILKGFKTVEEVRDYDDNIGKTSIKKSSNKRDKSDIKFDMPPSEDVDFTEIDD